MDRVICADYFELLRPGTMIKFSMKNPLESNSWFSNSEIEFIILDSYAQLKPPSVAVLIVPRGRENDFLICADIGRKRLLEKNFNVSRLILVSNPIAIGETTLPYREVPIEPYTMSYVKNSIASLVRVYYPKDCSEAEVRFIELDDGLVLKEIVDLGIYSTGDKAVHYVVTKEVCSLNGKFECKKRLRFQETGDIIHAEVSLKKADGSLITCLGDVEGGSARLVFDFKEESDPIGKALKYAVKLVGLEKKRGWNPFNKFMAQAQKKVLCFGGLFSPAVYNFLKIEGYEVFCADAYPSSFKDMMALLGVTPLLFPVYKCAPLDLLECIYNPRIMGSQDISNFLKECGNLFGILIVGVKSFQSGIYTSPPQEFLTLDCLKKLRKAVGIDGAVIIHSVPRCAVTLAETLKLLGEVFPKVMKIEIAGNNNSYMLVGLSSANGSSSSPVFEEFKLELQALVN